MSFSNLICKAKCLIRLIVSVPSSSKLLSLRSIIVIKVNIVKIYVNNTHFISRKYNITRIFIKVEYVFIPLQSRKKSFNHFTCNKSIGNKLNAARESSTALSHNLRALYLSGQYTIKIRILRNNFLIRFLSFIPINTY